MQAAIITAIIATVIGIVVAIDAPAPARDRAQVRAFLRQQGLDAVPEGYHVDHIIPLCAGGADSPENMQLLPIDVHREKTRIDLRWCYHLRQAREAEEDQRKWQEGYEQRSGHTSGPQ